MAQPKNMSNKSYITFLERALKKETNPDKKPNINACLKKARETTEAIGQEQVLWAVNGKDAFISNRLEQIEKVHRDHKADLSKVFAVCLTGCTAMMAGQGSHSGSPQSRGANTVSNPTPAPAPGRGQSPATADRAALQISNPTED